MPDVVAILEAKKDSWIDFAILAGLCSRWTDPDNFIILMFSHTALSPTTHVLLRRVLKELGHSIIKWDKVICHQSLNETDTLLTDIPSFCMEWAQEQRALYDDDVGFTELWVNHDHNSSSPSDDDSPVPPQHLGEDEPSPPSAS